MLSLFMRFQCNLKSVYFNSVMIENIESYLMGIGERVSFHDSVVVIICSFSQLLMDNPLFRFTYFGVFDMQEKIAIL